MQPDRGGVAEARGRLGEMLVEFGAVESEASRLVAAGDVHVVFARGWPPAGHRRGSRGWRARSSHHATMDVACRSWQWWARERVQVNAYLTTQGTSGFTLHWDDYDVVIVQLAGEKSWDVRTPSRPVPMYRDADTGQALAARHTWPAAAQRHLDLYRRG